MNRYFIGLMVPPTVRDQLHSFAKSIQADQPVDQSYKAVWNAPADLHCTLLFLGHAEREQHIIEQLAHVAHQCPPVMLCIAGQTHWLGRNSLALPATGAEVVGTKFIEGLGHLSSDTLLGRRPFYGHVTLGRVHPVPSAGDDNFSGHTVERLTWRARYVQLVTKLDGASVERYRVVAQAPFEG